MAAKKETGVASPSLFFCLANAGVHARQAFAGYTIIMESYASWRLISGTVTVRYTVVPADPSGISSPFKSIPSR
jgi:hypothetical protein